MSEKNLLEEAKMYYKEGNCLKRKKKSEEARKKYEKALRIVDPLIKKENKKKLKEQNCEIWTLRGRILSRLGDLEEPEDEKRKKYEESLKDINKAIKINSKSFNTWFEKGIILFKLKGYDKSLEAFDEAVKTEKEQKKDGAWNWRGRALFKLQRYVDALEDFDRATKINPGNFYAWYNKGTAHLKLKRYKDAHESFKKASKMKEGKNHSGVHNNKGYALFKLEKYVDALEDFDRAIEITREKDEENFYAWYNKGNALLKLKRYKDAHESFGKGSKTEVGKKNPRIYNYKGYALLKLERYENALIDFEKATKLLENPEETTGLDPKERTRECFYVLYNKGFTLFKLERYLEALKVFNKAINLEEEKEIQENIIMEETKNIKSNTRLEVKFNNMNPNIPPADLEKTKNNIAFAYMKLGMYEKAKKTLYDAILDNPKSISHHVSLGEFFLDHGDLDKALKAVMQILEIEERDALLLELKSKIEKENWDEASKLIDKYSTMREEKLEKEKVDALLLELKSEIEKENWDEASKLIDKYFTMREEKLEKEKVDAFILKGKIKIEEKDYDEAIKSFEKAIMSGLGDSRPLFLAAYARYLKAVTSPYRKGRNNREIIKTIMNLEKAACLSKRDGKREERFHILHFLGFLYYKRKDFLTAKERLQECTNLGLKPSISSTARELLDYIWNYKIRPPWWRWWLSSPSNSLRKRIVFSFLFLIICLTVVFHLFTTELLILIARAWKFYIIIEYLQGFRCWQISVAIIVLSVFFLIWPNVERIWIRDLGIEMSSPPSFEPDVFDFGYALLLMKDPEIEENLH